MDWCKTSIEGRNLFEVWICDGRVNLGDLNDQIESNFPNDVKSVFVV